MLIYETVFFVENKKFLDFGEDDCQIKASFTRPKAVVYSVLNYLPEVKKFLGHTCIIWISYRSVYTVFL